jgi:cytochrome P450
MQCSIDSFAAGQLILMGTNMAECDDALELDQTESHRIHLGKMPFKIGYIQVIINYRPAAVEQFLMWAHQKHGDVIEYHWKSRVISVGSYELAALLLKHPNFQRKGLFTETVTILNPFSLVSISGPDWTRAHWLMVRAIGRISIQDMCSSVKGAVHKLMSSTPLVLGGFVDLYDFAKKATLDAMISEIFGAGIPECESQVIHAGIDAIIGELQGLTQASSQYRISRQRLDALIDFKLETEYFSVIHSTNFHKDSVDLSSTFPPRQWASTATLDLPFNSGCHFLRTLVEQNASNHRSPTKASQSPFSLIQLRDLVINVLLFMGTINPAEACVHAVIEIFRSKHSISQREVWIETENLIGQHDSPDREAGFTRIIRESMRMFPPVAGLSFNRRATADTLIHGWRFKKDVSSIISSTFF